MTTRRKIIALVFSYVLGIAAGWGYFLYIRPTEEMRFQLQVDDAIRDELCGRIIMDLLDFDESPQTYRRSSLNILITESIAVVKSMFPNDNDVPAIKFRGVNSRPIVSECQEDASQWVQISTHFPDLYEAEVALITGNAPSAGPVQANEKHSAQLGTQERRIALIVGNSHYASRPLKNPSNDAKDVATALKNMGFSVVELYDAKLSDMRHTIKSFVEQLQHNDVGLVYYSGHGIEFAGRNYFIPVNADIKSEEEIPRQGFDVTEIVERMGRSNVKTSIFIIDACRNAPVFSSHRSAKSGLAMMHASRGSIIAFSAAPGQVALDGNARNSPYTSALLKEMQIPNKKIEDILKDTAQAVIENSSGRQVPWYNSSLVGDFYFSKQ